MVLKKKSVPVILEPPSIWRHVMDVHVCDHICGSDLNIKSLHLLAVSVSIYTDKFKLYTQFSFVQFDWLISHLSRVRQVHPLASPNVISDDDGDG